MANRLETLLEGGNPVAMATSLYSHSCLGDTYQTFFTAEGELNDLTGK